MTTPKNCEVCDREYDFETYASGSCSTCELKYLCWKCLNNHSPKDKSKRCQRIFITNPKWVMNLTCTVEKNEKL